MLWFPERNIPFLKFIIVPENQHLKNLWPYLTALIGLCLGLLFYGLWRLPLLGPDEPRYVEVAREMFLSGDWITPRLGGLLWFEKPALTYWLIAAGFTLSGISEAAARTGIALTASLGAGMLFVFGRQVQSAMFGYLSAATLLSCIFWLSFGRAATFDLPLAVTMQMALLSFFLWERCQLSSHSSSKNLWWYVCCFALGLAVLAKGLAGIVLPGIIIGFYLLLTGGLLRLLKRPGLLFTGAGIFLLTAATWYAPMFSRHGDEFYQEFFVGHHFQRYLSNKYQHPQPFYFFFAIALIGSLPWTPHLIAQAGTDLKSLLQRIRQGWFQAELAEGHRLTLFLWLWVLLPIVFFSLSGSKLPGYILPVFPAIALLTGQKLHQTLSQKQISAPAIISNLLLLLLGIFIAARGQAELAVGREAIVMAALIIGCSLVLMVLTLMRRTREAMLMLPFAMMLMVMVAAHLLFPSVGNRESLRELSLTARRVALPGEKLVFYINSEQSLHYYAPGLALLDRKAALITTMSVDEIVQILQTSHIDRTEPVNTLLVISLKKWSEAFAPDPRFTVESLGQQWRTDREGNDGETLQLFRLRLRQNGINGGS
jgi:4-amino-4-deoxy-L-arabinose transferase-like glycosyltransferase